jgi:hypothetical protein
MESPHRPHPLSLEGRAALAVAAGPMDSVPIRWLVVGTAKPAVTSVTPVLDDGSPNRWRCPVAVDVQSYFRPRPVESGSALGGGPM